MTKAYTGITRRHALAATGAGVLAAGLGVRPSFAATTVRQGYQTNMWGMPTYYLLHSGILKKHGIDAKEFAVPSGNLTMQQMVARQVDMGTFAGPSFVIGHDRGGLVAIAMIEYVGKTARVMARKELGLKTVADLKGKKIASQTGSSIGNILVDQILPKAGLHKGDYTEVRMNVNDMVAAMAAKTVDAMANVEPYNSIAEAEGIANTLVDYYSFDKLPVFMAATPDFVDKNGDAIVPYLKAWLEVAKDFKNEPQKVAEFDLLVLHLEGLQDVEGHLRQRARPRGGEPGLAGRSRRLHEPPRRGADEGAQDQENAGLEHMLPQGLHEEGGIGLKRREFPRRENCR